jgi:hypothetical protein
MNSRAFFILLVAVAGCAGQAEPPGGPRDSVPPEIIRTVPDTNAINVHPDVISLEFSEYVDRRTVEEAVFISPYLGELTFDWSGTEVEIRFPDTLRDNITYVVSVGTDVKDMLAGNRLARGFTLAFATGDSIDRGIVGGRVAGENPEGVMIFAYSLAGRRPDTLNPSSLRPEYVTQTGKDGRFHLSNLAATAYRIFAVRDEFRDFVYDRSIDDIGVPPADVALGPPDQRIEGLTFRLSREDTTAPFPASVAALDRHYVVARFNEPLDSASASTAAYSIDDTTAGTQLGISLSYLDRSTSQIVGIMLDDTLQEDRVYRFRALGVKDRAGNASSADSPPAEFTGTARPDTLRPTFALEGVADTVRGVPPGRSFEVRFSEPVLQGPVLDAIGLLDSLGREVISRREWLGPRDLTVIPHAPLRPAEVYRLTVPLGAVQDYRGNGNPDSTATIRIRTLDPRSTGFVAGQVQDNGRLGRPGPIAVTASSISMSPAVIQTTWTSGGKFTLQQLPEGRYLLAAFVDSDSSGNYSFGRAHPFRPAERFVLLQDTLRVRARWSVENVVLTFP